MSIATHILDEARSFPEGTVFGAPELAMIAARPALDQALKRLADSGDLYRVAQGAYTMPIVSRFGRRPPATEALVPSYVKRKGSVAALHGAAEANRLGLSTQVPLQEIWLTSGPDVTLHLGSRTVSLRHAPRWQLVDPDGRGGAALRALAWCGRAHAIEWLGELRRTLTPEERAVVLLPPPRTPHWLGQLARQEFCRA